MKKIKVLIVIAAVFLTHCGNNEILVNDYDKPGISSAEINGDCDFVAAGDSVDLTASFTSTGDVDSTEISFSWTVLRNEENILSAYDKNLSSWIPEEPGTYKIVLDVDYEGKTTRTILILIVQQKIVYVDDSTQQKLYGEYEKKLPGHYVGTVTTPWVHPYTVALHIDSTGHYSCYNVDTDRMPALYYGTDDDDPRKQIKLTDIRADSKAVGDIVIVFGIGTTNTDDIKDLCFSENYDSLYFNIWHHGKYGPLEAKLKRVDPAQVPPRPLPTPEINMTGERVQTGYEWYDSVTVSFSAPEEYEIIYQVIPSSGSSLGIINNDLWNEDLEFSVYDGPFTINEANVNRIILTRSRKNGRMSGVNAQSVEIISG